MRDGETFTIPEAPGYTFRLVIEDDDTSEAPWDRSDGHGPVREVYAYYGRPEKRAGERILASHQGSYWLYDWQAACKMAREDGWNAKPYDAPNRIERAVQADFNFLKGWLNNDWCYIGVCVELLDEDGDSVSDKYRHAIWGIESSDDKYILDVAREIAAEIADDEGILLSQRKKAWRQALVEAREKRYWAYRDVSTS